MKDTFQTPPYRVQTPSKRSSASFIRLDMIHVCGVCFSPVCSQCAEQELCHCTHPQNKQVWTTLQTKLHMIDQHRSADSKGEEVDRAKQLLLELKELTNYAPQFVTPLSRTLPGVPELSWRNASACVNCVCLCSRFVIYRVRNDEKEELGKFVSAEMTARELLPHIHALQCRPSVTIDVSPAQLD